MARTSPLFLLCLLFASWSAEAANTRALARNKRAHVSKVVVAHDDDDDDQADDTEGSDSGAMTREDISDSSDKKDDDSKSSDQKTDDSDVANDDDEDDSSDNEDSLSQAAKAVLSKRKATVALTQIAATPSQPANSAPAASPPTGLDQTTPKPDNSEKGKLEKELQELEHRLAVNQARQFQISLQISDMTNTSKSDEEITSSARQVANETESPAMASMLAGMWSEMRMFDVPMYVQQLKEEKETLEQNEKDLKHDVKHLKEDLKDVKKDQEEDKADEDEDKASGTQKALIKDKDVAKLQNPQDIKGSDHNFWLMSEKKQESFLAGSCVYLVAGIVLAYLHNKARDRKQDIFRAPPRNDVIRTSQDFSFSILGCFSAPAILVMGCCCPCMQWADTIDRHHFSSYWKAFLTFFILTVLYGYTYGVAPIVVIIMGVYYRQKLRETYSLENKTARSVGCDILAWTCCQPCAIIQEAKEQSVLFVSDP